MGSKRGRESGPPKLKSNIWFKCPPPSCLSERSTTVVRFWPGPPGTPRIGRKRYSAIQGRIRGDSRGPLGFGHQGSELLGSGPGPGSKIQNSESPVDR
jgi:hypothetical protein